MRQWFLHAMLLIGCLCGVGAAPLAAVAEQAGIKLLTAGDNAPYTAPELPNGGLITDLVVAAMTEARPPEGHVVHWIDDRSAHLDPLMSNADFDLAFPWVMPDCAALPGDALCTDFLFSDMVLESLTLVFTSRSAPILFAIDEDLEGKRLCRPRGQLTHDLDRPDRRWISDARITLEQPGTVKQCFDMLMGGQVDGVAIDEFVGRAAIRDLGLGAQVVALTARPLAINAQRVLIHKAHPNADALLAMINSGLREIRDNGTAQAITDTHMTRIWAGF